MFLQLHKKLFPLAILSLFFWQIQVPAFSYSSDGSVLAFNTVFAEDEEDEDEEDEEDEDEEDEEEDEDEQEAEAVQTETKQSSKPKTTTKTIDVIKDVVEYKPVTETVVVLDEAYQKDSDGDQLVDAVDPDPLIHQSEYFTDIDGDGVPNALDQHHDEDDFAYYDFETDMNNNGIIDSYEGE